MPTKGVVGRGSRQCEARERPVLRLGNGAAPDEHPSSRPDPPHCRSHDPIQCASDRSQATPYAVEEGGYDNAHRVLREPIIDEDYERFGPPEGWSEGEPLRTGP